MFFNLGEQQMKGNGQLLVDENDSLLLQAFTKSKDNKSKLTKENFLQQFKNKVLNLETLIQYGTFKFKINIGKTGSTLSVLTINKFFSEYGLKSYDFETIIKSPKNFSKTSGQRIALVDGILFFMVKREGDVFTKESLTVYCPVWQRVKATKILQRYFLDNRPQGIFIGGYGRTGMGVVDKSLADKEQFVRQDVYDHLDKVFNRMCNEKDWYGNNGKRFKETILLHGLPGTGKTSIFMHFAAKYKLNVGNTTPEDFVTNFNTYYNQAKDDERNPLLVLIEDIDACEELLLKEHKSKGFVGSPIRRDDGEEFTYSTFINTLDGAHPLDNMIVCLSTNHKHKLIPSVTRRGRVDHDIEITQLTSVEIAARVNTELSEYIATFDDDSFSISNITDLRHCKTKEEIDELAKWLKG